MNTIRVLIGILGMDQHEVGAIAVARMLQDAGMEVVYVSKFNLPESIVKASLEEDVDVIGLSCHSWEYLDYVPQLIALLQQAGLDIPVVLGGSVITPEDSVTLKGEGVAATFSSGSQQEEIVEVIRQIAAERKSVI